MPNWADVEVFKKARINREIGVVTWNDTIDIAPETVYSLATGSPLPDWMEKNDRDRGEPVVGAVREPPGPCGL
jgi:hypothetical protein